MSTSSSPVTDLHTCDELSIAHHDGRTECTEPGCTVPHALHRFEAACDELLGGCPCSGVRVASDAA